MSTDVLFARIAMLRENGMLTPVDEALKSKLSSSTIRQMYLRFGPSTLLKCTFCHPDDTTTYVLYHLPVNVLFPHLLHVLLLGIATSETVSGIEAHHWRRGALAGALLLFALDTYLTSFFAPLTDTSTPGPAGLFWLAATLRSLTLCAFDAGVAFLIYASATRRFLLFSAASSADPELARRRNDEMLTNANIALQMAATNIRAYSVARNAVLRNETLKAADDEYWRAVVAFEGSEGDESLFEDDEVQAAVAAAYGTGKIDVQTMRRETDAFVANATKNL
ncbi:uncharacterized protein A1O9_09750 [Exophiala aquamarina CBS 119918]|uniref:Uncharacterized protein n=1 Tax=Exophiala aquamarina CBS 119918 TaxID=1182545 RepID=A0A072PEH1_9EURO|nr:uncharacterized protein A1O9_09750 [Exophiala aquamarina CBS 119918]KEF53955.1 hypothetical protein A1O9_09750 [Exophiala aquamarina CBS 119918]